MAVTAKASVSLFPFYLRFLGCCGLTKRTVEPRRIVEEKAEMPGITKQLPTLETCLLSSKAMLSFRTQTIHQQLYLNLQAMHVSIWHRTYSWSIVSDITEMRASNWRAASITHALKSPLSKTRMSSCSKVSALNRVYLCTNGAWSTILI